MYKQIICFCLLAIYAMTAYAENQNEDNLQAVQVVPLVQYENLTLSSQSIRSSSAGVLINSTDVQFVGLYTQHVFEEPLDYDFPRLYHTIDTLLEMIHGRNQYIGIFKSESDQPVSGGINTYQVAAVYGHEMIHEPNISFVLGGGIALGNFGVKTSDGKNWPLIPVPLVRVNYHTDMLEAKFEFLTSPNLSFTLAPKNRLRLTGDFRMDQFRDSRDLIFEVALAYRLYSDQAEMGDFAGLSIGFKNGNYGAFKLGHKGEDESLEVHYKSLFVAIDVSVLKITAGYAFDGRTLYRETEKKDVGEGSYISVQGMYPF